MEGIEVRLGVMVVAYKHCSQSELLLVNAESVIVVAHDRMRQEF